MKTLDFYCNLLRFVYSWSIFIHFASIICMILKKSNIFAEI